MASPHRTANRTAAQTAVEAAWCFDQRITGLSLRAIAALTEGHFGYPLSSATVHRRIEHELTGIIAPKVEQLRAVENARLDSYLAALATDIEAGDPKAINAAVRISERRARLEGIDAPIKVTGEQTVRYIVEGVDVSRLT